MENYELTPAPAATFAVACVGPREELREAYLKLDPGSPEAKSMLEEKWVDVMHNIVTTEGKNDLLTRYFKGSAYTAVWFCGLISSIGYSAVAVTDTAASHAGWGEAGPTNAPNYGAATRPALTFGTAAAAVLATSSASSFTFSSAGTLKGMFTSSINTKDGATGVLYNAVLFTAGDRAVGIGDVVNVNVSFGV